MFLVVVSNHNYFYKHALAWWAFKGALTLEIIFSVYLFILNCKSSAELNQDIWQGSKYATDSWY